MSGEREDLILGYLDKIEGRLNRLGDHVRDLRLQMTRVEENLASLNRRFDRLEEPMWWTRRTGSDAT